MTDLVAKTGRARSINRHSWNDNDLKDLILNDKNRKLFIQRIKKKNQNKA